MHSTTKYILTNIGLAECFNNWNYKQVISPFTRIYLPTAGQAKVHLANGVIDVVPGYIYIIPAYCLHHCECNGLFTHYYIHLYEELRGNLGVIDSYDFKNKIEASSLDKFLIYHLYKSNSHKGLKNYNPRIYDNYSTLSCDISQSTREASYIQMENDGALKILISHFIKHASRKNKGLDNRVEKALLHIRENLSEAIKVSELAEISCLSVEHFTRKFSSQMGQSPIEYLQGKRIQQAQLMLQTDKTRIKDIAYSIGFKDVSYFNRVFKKFTGVTPNEYRDNIDYDK
ncbi:MAG: AraC family transcriptional regulator [Rikenellaceae bacterium]